MSCCEGFDQKIEELTETIKELNEWYEEEHDKRVDLEKKLAEANADYLIANGHLMVAIEALRKIRDGEFDYASGLRVIAYDTLKQLSEQ